MSPSLCWFLWILSLDYPNLLVTKGFVVVVVVWDEPTYCIHGLLTQSEDESQAN
uniref:Uncharacterized protein n=1 Tax=Arundo donax TaxID=35708 RepID=A0A0A9EUV5_ARUDO